MPVSAVRTKIRQEFERHRYVNQLQVVDVLLFQSHAEFQVRGQEDTCFWLEGGQDWQDEMLMHTPQETMNYWKQLNHVMKYFRAEEDSSAKLPQNFITGFLEVGQDSQISTMTSLTMPRDETKYTRNQSRYPRPHKLRRYA